MITVETTRAGLRTRSSSICLLRGSAPDPFPITVAALISVASSPCTTCPSLHRQRMLSGKSGEITTVDWAPVCGGNGESGNGRFVVGLEGRCRPGPGSWDRVRWGRQGRRPQAVGRVGGIGPGTRSRARSGVPKQAAALAGILVSQVLLRQTSRAPTAILTPPRPSGGNHPSGGAGGRPGPIHQPGLRSHDHRRDRRQGGREQADGLQRRGEQAGPAQDRS